MRRPLAAAVGVSAVLHVCVLLWAGLPPSVRDAGWSAHGTQKDAIASTLRVELRRVPPQAAARPAEPRAGAQQAATRRPSRPARASPAAQRQEPAAIEVSASPQPEVPASGAQPAPAKSMADILRSVPAATRDAARHRAPNEALADSTRTSGTSPLAPLEKALTPEASGERRMADGLTRVVTKDGSSFCMRETHAHPGAIAMVSSCP